MGQNSACRFESEIARGMSIKREITEEIKPKINPLKYIHPLNLTFDEPDDDRDDTSFTNPLEKPPNHPNPSLS